MILDEASLAGTLPMDRIAACVGEAGAKLLLVGDWAQLSAIDAGGAFGLLARDRGPGVPELGAARRFAHAWEREASTRLRVGDPSCLDDYEAHDRLSAGDHPAMVDAAYLAWATDERAGLRSLLIAGDRDTVRSLNERARAELVVAGAVEPHGTVLHDGLVAGVGDRIVTRRNDRRLGVGEGWVKNGDTWTVVARHDDGALAVRRGAGGPAVVLPATYTAEHVELGYATTAFRAQGATVDTAHAVVSGASMTREVLYVALTRARQSNRAYVCTDVLPEPLQGFADVTPTSRGVLTAVLSHVGAATSAHEVGFEEAEALGSIRTLAAEYETIANLAEAPHWTALLERSGLASDQVRAIEASPAFGALTTSLRRAEGYGLNVEAALPSLADRASVGAVDIASVLHERIDRWTTASITAGRGRPARLVGGLIPAASHVLAEEIADALTERERLIDERADLLVERAKAAGAPWLGELGPTPVDAAGRSRWDRRARVVAAYRDRDSVTDAARALGADAVSDRQQADARTLAADVLTAQPDNGRAATRPEQRRAAPPTPSLERQSAVGR